MSAQPAGTERGWFKSSRSSSNANCVEVRFAAGGVGVRDSKDPGGPALAFAGAAWADFVRAIGAVPPPR
ncbi:DUF397 domain-containing protein [Micromonospora sp. DT233]|uniref:DUF397 domain-containing protein n=1 Tax=Micromonospora sp. DT233 TaxID=3393432 RepID=UPI003CF60498